MNQLRPVLLGIIFSSFVLLSSIHATAAPERECAEYPKVKRQIFQTALNNLLSLDYVRHSIETDRAEGIQFCTQGIILGSNVWRYGLFYFQISVINTYKNVEIRNYSFLYQDASTQANHNTKFLNWVGLSGLDAKENFGQLLSASTFTETQTSVSLQDPAVAEETLIEYLKTTKYFDEANDDIMTLSSIKVADQTYLFTWLDKSFNSFAQTQLIKSVMIRVGDHGQIQVSPNRFLYSELRTPLLKSVERAEKTITAATDLKAYLMSISPGNISRVTEDHPLFKTLSERTASISSAKKSGSGIFLGEVKFTTAEGKFDMGLVVVTNFHVAGTFGDATESDLVRLGGQRFGVKTKRCHALRDLCILVLNTDYVQNLSALQLKPLELIPMGQLKRNDLLIFSGYLNRNHLWSATHLIDKIAVDNAEIGRTDYLSFVLGMSGGPVFNRSGSLIGVISFLELESTNTKPKSYFLPTDWIVELLNSKTSDYTKTVPFYLSDEKFKK